MIIPGTTPTHTFGVPFTTDDIARVSIVYVQDENVVIDREIENGDTSIEDGKITITLTQAETLLLVGNDIVEMQVGVVTKDGSSFRSRPIQTSTGRVLKKEEI